MRLESRVRVRRERPNALSWILALAVTAAAVAAAVRGVPSEEVPAAARVDRAWTAAGACAYFVDMGAFRDEMTARLAAAKWAQRGAAGVLLTDEAGVHVLGAAYETEADAARIVRRLSEDGHISAEILRKNAPDVKLKITARPQDAEALMQADERLRTHLPQTAVLAGQVDRGELSASSARTLARVAAAELKDAAEALKKVRGGEKHPLCRGLTALLEHFAARLKDIGEGNLAGAVLSGRLRAAHAEGLLELMDFLNKI